jgi:hypothetical protein
MTIFVSFRTSRIGGPVCDARVFEGDKTSTAFRLIDDGEWRELAAGRNLRFVTHGFNVNLQTGVSELARFGDALALPLTDLYIGVLWPGDSWIPIVDYPFEGDVAIECGRRLAGFCDTLCTGAASLSFASHSLGGRLILEAVSRLRRRASVVCVTAGAVNRDCLITEYRKAADKADAVAALASHDDLVLKLAFTVGDPLADLLHPDHTPFQAALGYDGPPRDHPAPVAAPWQIDDHYDHDNYLPPDDPQKKDDVKWRRVATFVRQAFLGQPQSWP